VGVWAGEASGLETTGTIRSKAFSRASGDSDMELTSLQRLALEACHKSKSEIGETCYKWISHEYKDAGVNPHHLKQLERLGYLVRAEGNSRNWYKVVTGGYACQPR
jgi:hypothetical protein